MALDKLEGRVVFQPSFSISPVKEMELPVRIIGEVNYFLLKKSDVISIILRSDRELPIKRGDSVTVYFRGGQDIGEARIEAMKIDVSNSQNKVMATYFSPYHKADD